MGMQESEAWRRRAWYLHDGIRRRHQHSTHIRCPLRAQDVGVTLAPGTNRLHFTVPSCHLRYVAVRAFLICRDGGDRHAVGFNAEAAIGCSTRFTLIALLRRCLPDSCRHASPLRQAQGTGWTTVKNRACRFAAPTACMAN